MSNNLKLSVLKSLQERNMMYDTLYESEQSAPEDDVIHKAVSVIKQIQQRRRDPAYHDEYMGQDYMSEEDESMPREESMGVMMQDESEYYDEEYYEEDETMVEEKGMEVRMQDDGEEYSEVSGMIEDLIDAGVLMEDEASLLTDEQVIMLHEMMHKGIEEAAEMGHFDPAEEAAEEVMETPEHEMMETPEEEMAEEEYEEEMGIEMAAQPGGRNEAMMEEYDGQFDPGPRPPGQPPPSPGSGTIANGPGMYSAQMEGISRDDAIQFIAIKYPGIEPTLEMLSDAALSDMVNACIKRRESEEIYEEQEVM